MLPTWSGYVISVLLVVFGFYGVKQRKFTYLRIVGLFSIMFGFFLIVGLLML